MVLRLILSFFQQDGLAAPEVDIGRGKIVDALVVAPVVECI